jgi:hypothetical protein
MNVPGLKKHVSLYKRAVCWMEKLSLSIVLWIRRRRTGHKRKIKKEEPEIA